MRIFFSTTLKKNNQTSYEDVYLYHIDDVIKSLSKLENKIINGNNKTITKLKQSFIEELITIDPNHRITDNTVKMISGIIAISSGSFWSTGKQDETTKKKQMMLNYKLNFIIDSFGGIECFIKNNDQKNMNYSSSREIQPQKKNLNKAGQEIKKRFRENSICLC